LDPEPQHDAAPALAKDFGSISAADMLLYIGMYCYSVFGSLSPPVPVTFHNRGKYVRKKHLFGAVIFFYSA
jgi:hypothetical protein